MVDMSKEVQSENTKKYETIRLSRSRVKGRPVKEYRRLPTWVRRMGPILIVANEDVTEHEGFHPAHRHTIRRDLLEQLPPLAVENAEKSV